MKIYVILPCYNEGEALPCLLNSLNEEIVNGFKEEYEVVIVNDGSYDDTEKVARGWSDRLNINLINHPQNMGLGEAVNTGLSYFSGSCTNEDIAVIMDGDNTHNPQYIPLMVEKLRAGNDVVIASRYQYGGEEIGLSFIRKLCSAAASVILYLFYKIPGVKDYTCGYRAYSAMAVKRAYGIFGENFIEEKGFTCMAEVIIKLHYIGCEISEIPLVLRYDLKKGKSKMKVIRTIARYLMLILNCRHYSRNLVTAPAFSDGKEK